METRVKFWRTMDDGLRILRKMCKIGKFLLNNSALTGKWVAIPAQNFRMENRESKIGVAAQNFMENCGFLHLFPMEIIQHFDSNWTQICVSRTIGKRGENPVLPPY